MNSTGLWYIRFLICFWLILIFNVQNVRRYFSGIMACHFLCGVRVGAPSLSSLEIRFIQSVRSAWKCLRSSRHGPGLLERSSDWDAACLCSTNVLLGEEGFSGLIKYIWKLFFTSLIHGNYSFLERKEFIRGLRPREGWLSDDPFSPLGSILAMSFPTMGPSMCLKTLQTTVCQGPSQPVTQGQRADPECNSPLVSVVQEWGGRP